jgi:hypothetical protein
LLTDGDDHESASTKTGDRGHARPASSVTPTTSAVTATTLTGPACRSPISPDAPLRLWIAGDSLAASVGSGLGKRAANTGVVAPVFESRVSSGISSPSFFDWPKRAGEEIPRLDPEIVVFVMGTNDWMMPQATPVDASGAPAWKAKYETQVQTMVDLLASDGRTLYWVGPPVLRDPKQEAGATQLAEVIKTVVGRHPTAQYFDAHDLLDTADGGYTPSVDVDGRKVQIRSGDGVHFTTEGGEFVGDALFEKIDAQCRIKDQAVPGERQQLMETKGSTTAAPRSPATAPSLATPTAPPATPPATTPPTTAPPATAVPTTAPPPTTTAPPTTQTTTKS